MKRILWVGTSRDDVKSFPAEVRREVGYQLHKVQQGEAPDDWKPMTTVGSGVNEIRVRDVQGTFRVVYLARIEDVAYVLHAFQKKSTKTSRHDLEIAQTRLRAVMRRR